MKSLIKPAVLAVAVAALVLVASTNLQAQTVVRRNNAFNTAVVRPNVVRAPQSFQTVGNPHWYANRNYYGYTNPNIYNNWSGFVPYANYNYNSAYNPYLYSGYNPYAYPAYNPYAYPSYAPYSYPFPY